MLHPTKMYFKQQGLENLNDTQDLDISTNMVWKS